MTTRHSRLERIGKFARHHMTFKIARAVQHTRRPFDQCSGRCIPTMMLPERQQQTWQFKRSIHAILIRIKFRACTISTMPCLPFIRPLQVYIKFLASTKSVTTCDTNHKPRSHASRRFSRKVRLNIKVPRFV